MLVILCLVFGAALLQAVLWWSLLIRHLPPSLHSPWYLVQRAVGRLFGMYGIATARTSPHALTTAALFISICSCAGLLRLRPADVYDGINAASDGPTARLQAFTQLEQLAWPQPEDELTILVAARNPRDNVLDAIALPNLVRLHNAVALTNVDGASYSTLCARSHWQTGGAIGTASVPQCAFESALRVLFPHAFATPSRVDVDLSSHVWRAAQSGGGPSGEESRWNEPLEVMVGNGALEPRTAGNRGALVLWGDQAPGLPPRARAVLMRFPLASASRGTGGAPRVASAILAQSARRGTRPSNPARPPQLLDPHKQDRDEPQAERARRWEAGARRAVAAEAARLAGAGLRVTWDSRGTRQLQGQWLVGWWVAWLLVGWLGLSFCVGLAFTALAPVVRRPFSQAACALGCGLLASLCAVGCTGWLSSGVGWPYCSRGSVHLEVLLLPLVLVPMAIESAAVLLHALNEVVRSQPDLVEEDKLSAALAKASPRLLVATVCSAATAPAAAAAGHTSLGVGSVLQLAFAFSVGMARMLGGGLMAG